MPTGAFRQLNVFLSYASQDATFAEALNDQLQTAGFDVWFDKERLSPGTVWDPAIRKGIADADAIVPCLSKHSVSKEGYIQKELKVILDKAAEMPDDCHFIFPVRLDDCVIPKMLLHLQHIDLFNRSTISQQSAVLDRALFVRLARGLSQRAIQLEQCSSSVEVPPIFRFTQAQIKKQLRMILKSSWFEGQLHHRLILKYLVDRAIVEPDENYPECLTSLEDLATVIESDFGRFDLNATRTLIAEVNSKLEEFYSSTMKDKGEILFHIPRLRNPRSTKKLHCKITPIEQWKPRVKRRPSSLRALWQPLISRMLVNLVEGPPPEVLIIYSNEQPEHSEHEDPRGRYSGSGEVIAAHLLGCTLTRLGFEHQIARSRSVTRRTEAPEFTLRPNSIRIYLGSSLANASLRDIRDYFEWHDKQRFKFGWHEEDKFVGEIKEASSGNEKGEVFRYNSYPGHKDHELDYALVSVLYSAEQNATVFCLAGLSTLGTEQAARFVCDDTYVSDIFTSLGVKELLSFEMVREVVIVAGQPTGGPIKKLIKHD